MDKIQKKIFKIIFYSWWILPLQIAIYFKIKELTFRPTKDFSNYEILFHDIFFNYFISISIIYLVFIFLFHYYWKYKQKNDNLVKLKNSIEKYVAVILVIITFLFILFIFYLFIKYTNLEKSEKKLFNKYQKEKIIK